MHAESVLDDYRQHTFRRWAKKGVDIQKLEGEINYFVRTFSPVPNWIHSQIKPVIKRHLKSLGGLQQLAKDGSLPGELVRAVEIAATNLSDGVGIGIGPVKIDGGPGAPPNEALLEFASRVAEILRPLGDPYPRTVQLISNVIPGGSKLSPDSLKRQLRRWRASQQSASGVEKE